MLDVGYTIVYQLIEQEKFGIVRIGDAVRGSKTSFDKKFKFSEASHAVFTKQEAEYASGRGFRLFSMLTLAFLQMGIIKMEETPQQ